jgi:hypothetical protein
LAGRKANNDTHRPRRIGLRTRDPRNSRQRGSARCQVQESATGKFHTALTASSRNSRLDAPYVNDETVMPADGARAARCNNRGFRRVCRCDILCGGHVFKAGARKTTEIRRIRADEGLRLRALRLRALSDSPTAYGSTLASEELYPESIWHERAASGAAGRIVPIGHARTYRFVDPVIRLRKAVERASATRRRCAAGVANLT